MLTKARRFAVLSLLGLVLVAGVALVALPSNESVAADIGEPGTLSGPGIGYRDTSKLSPLANSQMVIMPGTKDSDGICHYSVDFSAKNGDTRPQMAREIARDPASCRFQIERGNPTTLPPDPTGGSSTSSETSTK